MIACLKLKGTIPDEEVRHPTGLDQDNESCVMVIKRGNATGLTVGCANNIFLYTRNYFDNDNPEPSREWAIFPFNLRSEPFSDKEALDL